nr:unnamed protein product [Callosobruchus analis]
MTVKFEESLMKLYCAYLTHQ